MGITKNIWCIKDLRANYINLSLGLLILHMHPLLFFHISLTFPPLTPLANVCIFCIKPKNALSLFPTDLWNNQALMLSAEGRARRTVGTAQRCHRVQQHHQQGPRPHLSQGAPWICDAPPLPGTTEHATQSPLPSTFQQAMTTPINLWWGWQRMRHPRCGVWWCRFSQDRRCRSEGLIGFWGEF